MSFFDEAEPVAPAERRAPSRAVIAGVWALVVALVALLGMSFLPSGYVIEQPGPVYNTIGDVTDADGEKVPLLTVEDADTYPTSGSLDLLTVQVVGSPERPPSWLEVMSAWFDRTRAVVPMESVFPTGQTSSQRDELNAVMMTDSQLDAQAAAFTELGYDVEPTLSVMSVVDDGPAAGILQQGDEIDAVNGTAVTEGDALRAAINDTDGSPVTLTISRGGASQDVSITPVQGDTGAWLVGITVQVQYTLPYETSFALDNVGGPSAGMMFALGIIDTLTPGELAGGAQVAGTGTITADGTVGAIGGIRQKMWGAVGAGAEYFLAPASNCDEVVGYVPDGLRVFSVATLDDAVGALEQIGDGGDLDALPTCTAAAGP